MIVTRSVIVNHLDIVGVAVAPGETDAPLVIDADAVLPCPVATQSFQPVARRRPEVIKRCGGVQHEQFDPTAFLK
jgi:hypothetical protein